MASWLGNLPVSVTAPLLVFTPTLKAFDTLLARISDFTLVVIQLSDITFSALLAALAGVMAVVPSDWASAMFVPRTSAEAMSVAPRVTAMREILLGFWCVVIGYFLVSVNPW